MLTALHQDLEKLGTRLRVVGAHARVRDLLRATGLEEQIGYLGRHISVDQAITELDQPNETHSGAALSDVGTYVATSSSSMTE